MVSRGAKGLVSIFVLLLIPAYVGMVYSLPGNVAADCEEGEVSGPFTDRVGFCSRIGFSVTRSYYFGLLRLPVYRLGVNLDTANRLFLPLLLGLTLLVWRKEIRANSNI